MSIIISKMDRPERAGDWHDAKLKWQARGPGQELQKFPRKKDAVAYARIRRDCGSSVEAINAYARI